jgi:LPXTG-motif cell wall-anchored protein
MRFRTLLVTIGSLLGAMIAMSGPTHASSATYSDTGTLSSNGSWANTLTFADPNVTATFDVTNTYYKAVAADNTCMRTDACAWWGVDEESGWYCGDLAANANAQCRSTSLVNSVLAYTPNSVAYEEGVTWTWASNPLCGTRYPKPSNPNILCEDVSTVTIQFSAPVSNAILHLANIGGNGNRITYRSDDFSRGFDYTLYSKWNLTSGQRIEMLSGEETTNITVDGSTIRSKYIPQGVGARPGVGDCAYNSQTCRNKNGTGSGSFLIHGTYSTITFDIDLGFSLVNYGWNETPSDSLVDSVGNDWVPEGVSVQLSFYESGPALPTTTTAAPSTTVSPSISAGSSSNNASPTTVAPTLPETGSSGQQGTLVAALMVTIGALIAFRARRLTTR